MSTTAPSGSKTEAPMTTTKRPCRKRTTTPSPPASTTHDHEHDNPSSTTKPEPTTRKQIEPRMELDVITKKPENTTKPEITEAPKAKKRSLKHHEAIVTTTEKPRILTTTPKPKHATDREQSVENSILDDEDMLDPMPIVIKGRRTKRLSISGMYY